ncbi:MAG: carboxypeptidase-like regulatory domain-containing protein [Bacteroidales bacterium]|jgi:hypothetical protein|nr:carboxypeptidase-like regulatory domain-containing protein [Bacteroidales bacterium]
MKRKNKQILLSALIFVSVFSAFAQSANTNGEVYFIPTLHGAHQVNSNYNYDSLKAIIARLNPEIIAVEIRSEDLEQDTLYLQKSYPDEMINMKKWFPDAVIVGFDWLGKDIEGKLIPDNYFQKTLVKKLEKQLNQDSLYSDKFALCNSRWKERSKIFRTHSLKQLLESEDGEIVKNYYRCLNIQAQGTPYEPIADFYAERDRHILANIRKIIAQHGNRRIVIVTGDDHYQMLKDSIPHNSIYDKLETENTITISGQVTDFNGNPIDSCTVGLFHEDFSTAYETCSDSEGNYTLKGVEKGSYMAMYALRMKEYPRENAVPEEDMRLEFWAWNVVADRDLTINPRYHKLELYGLNVFKVMGGYNGFFIYFRPMSVTKVISHSKENYLDKKKMEDQNADVSVKPEYLDVKVFADGEPMKINSITPVEEYGGTLSITGYIVQVDAPKTKPDKPYVIFRVEAENREFNEKGENLYFYEIKDYK